MLAQSDGYAWFGFHPFLPVTVFGQEQPGDLGDVNQWEVSQTVGRHRRAPLWISQDSQNLHNWISASKRYRRIDPCEVYSTEQHRNDSSQGLLDHNNATPRRRSSVLLDVGILPVPDTSPQQSLGPKLNAQ